MQKEIKRILAEKTELEKDLAEGKNQDLKKSVEIENFIRQNSQDRDTIETNYRTEISKTNEEFKLKEEKLKTEISKMNKELELFRKESAESAQDRIIMTSERFTRLNKENERLKKENSRLKKHSKNYEKQIDQIKNAPVQFMNLAEEEDNLVSVLKLNQKLEEQISLKDEEIEEMAQNFNNVLSGETQKVKSLKEKLNKNKDKYEERKGRLLKSIADKEEQIEGLKIRLQKANSNSGTPSSKFTAGGDSCQISNTEMTLLRMCQNMVDAASSIECSKCGVCLQPTIFHEHISDPKNCPNSTPDDYEFTMRLDDEVSTIPHTDKNMNLYSNKSSKMELHNLAMNRPRSVSRKDYQFGSMHNGSTNSFMKQSLNPAASCMNFEPNLNNTYQNPLAMSMNRPACQSVCGGLNCSGQFNQGFGSILAQHNHIMASQADLHPSHTISNERMVAKLETTEHLLKDMNKKVDQIQRDKHSHAKQLKKLTKRFSNSVSNSREGMLFSARNINYPSVKKFAKKKEIDDSEINFDMSDGTPQAKVKKKSKGNSRYNKTTRMRGQSRKESPRYTRMFGKYEQEQEVNMNSSTEKASNQYTAVNTSTIKHAVADLGEDSNDYNEDMDESVAFSKKFPSDKENQETLKEYTTKNRERFITKKPRKLIKTNRNDFSNSRKNILEYSTNPKSIKGVKKMAYYDKRRGSYLK